jgi:hypothetical protein
VRQRGSCSELLKSLQHVQYVASPQPALKPFIVVASPLALNLEAAELRVSAAVV